MSDKKTPRASLKRKPLKRHPNRQNENLRTDVGGFGETLAVEHLFRAGFRIVERNWTARAAEIDIVAQDRLGAIWFFEVKFRRRASSGTAAESFTSKKRHDFFRAVSLYCSKFGLYFDETRSGLVAIDQTESGYRITRYSNLSPEE